MAILIVVHPTWIIFKRHARRKFPGGMEKESNFKEIQRDDSRE